MKPHSFLMAIFALLSSVGLHAQGYLTDEEIREKMEIQRDLDSMGLRGVLTLEDVPKRITYEPGKVSLVADPESQFTSSKKVYLINDTDEPLEGVIGENRDPVSQVQVGGMWIRDEARFIGCGTVAPPANLPPHRALILTGWCATEGDLPCERRFTFHAGNRNLTSNSFSGVCSRETVEVALRTQISVDEESTSRAHFGRWWKRAGAETMEEFVAVLELARCHSQFGTLRAELLDVLRSSPADMPEEEKRAMEGIAAVLKKAWLFNNDKQSLAARCIVALNAPGTDDYGTPEKFPSLVWRYLATQWLTENAFFYQNGVRFPGRASLVKLVGMANAVIEKSSDSDEVGAAASFLASRFLDESLVPLETYRDFLKSGKIELTREGLSGLSNRGRADEAGQWLASNLDETGDQVAKLHARIWPKGFGEPKPWEMKVIERSLMVDPWTLFGNGTVNLQTVPPERFPVAWKSSIRQRLRAQFDPEEIVAWEIRSEASRSEPGDFRVALDFKALDTALNLVNSWKDTADNELFRDYLEFPAFVFTLGSRGAGWKEFRARATAEEILKGRDVRIPGVVTKKLVVLAEPQSGYQDVLRQWHRKRPWIAPLFSGICVTWIFMRLAQRRSLRLSRAA